MIITKTISRGIAVIASGVFLAFSSQQAAAAVDYFDLSPEQLLNAHVISASKTETKVADTPAAVYVITQEDIARSGLNSIPELLRLAPGVDVARQDANSWAISIRGFNGVSSNKLLVMIDGRTVYNPLFAATFWEEQDYPLEDIERIEVVRGPGGTLWGANAVDGVINIITKNARDTTGNLVSGGAGNYENGFTTVRHGGALNGDDNSFYRFYAKYNDESKFPALSGNEAHDEWDNFRTGFRSDWGNTNSADQVSIHGDLYHVNSDEYSTSYSLTSPYSAVAQETVKSDGGNLTELWQHKTDSGATFKLQSYFEYTSRDQILFQDHRGILDIDGQYNFVPSGRHELIVGGGYRVVSDKIGGSDEVEFDPAERTDIVANIFAQDKITLQPEHWFLTLGSKVEHTYYTGVEIEPNARLEWTPDAKQTVWTSVSRAVRTPSRIERDMNISRVVYPPGTLNAGFPSEIILTENKDLDSEDLTAYEVGYRKQITPELSVDTTAFANDYDNLVSAVVLPQTFIPAGADPAHFIVPLVAVNQMAGEVYGAEIASSWKVLPNWKLSGGYTYLQMYLHAPTELGLSQEGAERSSPSHQLNLRSYWNINDDWTLDTMAYYVSRLQNYDVPAYVRVDMNLGWHINKGLQFNLIGQNLFDSTHREFSSATAINSTEIPRSVFGKFTWQF